MGAPSASHFASLLLPLLLFLSSSFPPAALSVNVTALLAPFPDLSAFARLLATTSVAVDLLPRSSVTLLAVPNSALRRSSPSPSALPDAVRYHVLLQYLSPADLRRIPPGGQLVPTLYQATGRAAGVLGSVNLTRSASGAVAVCPPVPSPPSNATILALVTALPYNISVFAVDALVAPAGSDLAASDDQPPPAGLNITGVLIAGGDFNVAAAMLAASGVAAELERDERGAGITVFAPTDEAFAALRGAERVQSLSADRKAAVLRFHVLHSYYPLGSLEGIVNPGQPTLETEGAGAGRFTLNITRVNGSVAIGTGIVQAAITRTVFDQNPVAVFGINRVLLPREFFAEKGRSAPGSEAAEAPPPPEEVVALPPGGPPEVDAPPARLSSPPGLTDETGSRQRRGSVADRVGGGGGILLLLCTEILYLLLV